MKRLVVKAMVVIMLTVVGCSAIGGTRETEAASNKGQKVVNYAKRFVGNKYRYGGTSLTRGADCSGYVMSVYRKFGKRLPHSSYGMRKVGKKVKGGIKKAKPGPWAIGWRGIRRSRRRLP